MCKHPTTKAKGPNATTFLDMYIRNHGVPSTIRLVKAKCLVEKQVPKFCNKNYIDIKKAPVKDHRAIGLVISLKPDYEKQTCNC